MSQISRRDFLKRAGKDVAETGAKIVPGGQAAKRFLEGDKNSEGEANFVENPRRHWWDRLVMWKRDNEK
jgi:hypothetical protein